MAAKRLGMMRNLEKYRQSRVITMIHRQETMNFLGFPIARYIDIENSEHLLRAIRMTPVDMPIDLVLHTPGGLVLASEQIACALHIVSTRLKDFPLDCQPHGEMLRGRSMLVVKTDVLPVEYVVRGYLSGSGWEEYMRTGEVCSIPLPKGLLESSKLKEPIFTPATKAEIGQHDENITFEELEKIVGKSLAQKLRTLSISIYKKARDYAERKGILIADTKMEFGIKDGKLHLIDELLTPDSSRFWPKDEYRPGAPQKSFDKQFLRDYLLSIRWNKTPPSPQLPEEVIQKTRQKYLDAYVRLVGKSL